jgi:hypothetical protein
LTSHRPLFDQISIIEKQIFVRADDPVLYTSW